MYIPGLMQCLLLFFSFPTCDRFLVYTFQSRTEFMQSAVCTLSNQWLMHISKGLIVRWRKVVVHTLLVHVCIIVNNLGNLDTLVISVCYMYYLISLYDLLSHNVGNWNIIIVSIILKLSEARRTLSSYSSTCWLLTLTHMEQ